MNHELLEIHARSLQAVNTQFKRFLYHEIDWRARLIALVGARGVGKSTLLLQRIKEQTSQEVSLYLSADNVRVAALGLYEIAGDFFRTGGKVLIIDEAQKYPSWSNEVKSIYDAYPEARIIVSGSSTLDLMKGGHDLSRRMILFRLPTLSFREFLSLETGAELKTIELEEILSDHTQLATAILSTLNGKILELFSAYLNHGFYPYYLEGVLHYHNRMERVIEKVISEDIPSVTGLKPSSVPSLRRILYLVASSQPLTPNIDKLAKSLGISRESLYLYLEYLEAAGLLRMLRAPDRGHKAVRKPKKIYLSDPNMFYTILGERMALDSVGAMREAFFFSQTSPRHQVQSSNTADFLLEQTYTVEVGGRNKSFEQIKKTANSFLACDGIEVGAGGRIPLWLFGFLY